MQDVPATPYPAGMAIVARDSSCRQDAMKSQRLSPAAESIGACGTQGIIWFERPWSFSGSGYVTYDPLTGRVVKILDNRALNRGKA